MEKQLGEGQGGICLRGMNGFRTDEGVSLLS